MVCTFFRFAVYTDARSIAVTACNRLIIAAAGKRTSQRNTRSLARTVYRAVIYTAGKFGVCKVCLSRTNTRSISASYRRTITARIKLYAALHETADQSSD